MSQLNDTMFMQLHEHIGVGLKEEAGVGNLKFLCHGVGRINSRGLWLGDDPLSFSFPLLLLQLSLISIFTRFIYVLLKPFGQPSIVSQILGGLLLGPSILGQNATFSEKVFPLNGRTLLETLSVFGMMLFIFLIGVKIDPSSILKSNKQVFAIATLALCMSFGVASCVRLIICHLLSLDGNLCNVLHKVVKMQSMTAFPVIAIFLAELNILNSEIGRLACSSSMVADLIYGSIMLLYSLAKITIDKSVKMSIGYFLSVSLLLSFIVFGIRPAILWAIRHTPEGKPVKEIYVFIVLVTLMCCGFIGEVIGINAILSAFILGLVIPDGPPLGAALVERLDCFTSVLLMPIFFTLCGLKTNVFTIKKWKTVCGIVLVIFAGFIGKLIGTIAPPLLYRTPFRDALSLGLIMNSRGIIELLILDVWRTENVMNDECFAIMIISVVVVTGVISPLIKFLYDPSRRFLAYKRRTIQHHRWNEELRVLACIYSLDNIQTILTLLDVSNTKESRISLFVLHLIKLAGRASSLLIPYLPRKTPSDNPTLSELIFNAFKKFELENQSHITLTCYKGISPYETMHNDVCSLALEQRISFIIIPFYKQRLNKMKLKSVHSYRQLNKNVLDKAPCSIGVLIDRGNQRRPRCLVSESLIYQVAVLFFGGPDDREALAYAGRMLEHPHVVVTLLHFTSSTSTDIVSGTARSKTLDAEILNKFRSGVQCNARVSYLEEVVHDSRDFQAVIGTLGNAFDLVMVGKDHADSKFISALGKWTKHSELGEVGELIAGSDSKLAASVLVVQQQRRVWGLRDPEESLRLRTVKI
ncbi:hypothetical protein K2173_023653 [Erythroxylum novogranatense]|uniref:Cation/H+ exchanger domain-containing protein n=1 Tax=Erythroxylum novogranatense TaxID=1862640 RepID=A0AAV8TS75_9ROSI|nr:hypothetical protein K2173_023653 [Erythroxylum novogranatense]